MKIDIGRLVFIGVNLLKYTEKEVWQMTLGKLLKLFDEYKKHNGLKEEKKTIDDIIPF